MRPAIVRTLTGRISEAKMTGRRGEVEGFAVSLAEADAQWNHSRKSLCPMWTVIVPPASLGEA
jgi:hypothetical protein